MMTLVAKKEELEGRETALKERKANLDAEAEQKAENLSEAKIRGIKGAYKTKTGAFFALCFGGLLYGVLVTVLTALRSEAFKSDFIEFFVTIGKGIAFLWGKLLWLSESAGNLCQAIPNDTAAMIIDVIVTVLVFLLVLGVVGGGILYGLILLIGWYSVHLADYISIAFFLIPFALLTFFADEISAFTGANILVLLLASHTLYGVIRMVIGAGKEADT